MKKSDVIFENILLIFAAMVFSVLWLAISKEDTVFVLTVFGTFFSVFMFEKISLGSSLRFSFFTIPSFFMLCYIVLMAGPSIYVFSTMSSPMKYDYFLAVQSVLITFPMGIFLANSMFRGPSGIIENYLFSDIKRTSYDFEFVPVYRIFLLISFFLLFLYFKFSGHVQLFELIKQYPASIDAEELRFAENELPNSIHFLFEILRRVILPICVLYAYFMSYVYRGRWVYRFWVLLSVTLIINLLTLDRGPFIGLFALLLLAFLLARNKSIWKVSFSPKMLLLIALVALVGGGISVAQYQSDFSWGLMLTNSFYVLTYRILQDAAFMCSLAFELFNYDSGLLYGKCIRLFSILPGFNYVHSVNSYNAFSVNAFSLAPVSFVGDLWRNWGWPGIITGPICIGFIYQFVQLKLFREKNVIILSLQVFLILGSILIIHGNLLGVVTTSIFLSGVWLGNSMVKRYKRKKVITEGIFNRC